MSPIALSFAQVAVVAAAIVLAGLLTGLCIMVGFTELGKALAAVVTHAAQEEEGDEEESEEWRRG